MKNIIQYLFISFTLFLLCACEEAFLDEAPRDRLTAENLYATPAGFENGLNALYAFVRQERQSYGLENMRSVLATAATDDYYLSRFAPYDNAFVQWKTFMNPTLVVISDNWNWLYRIINAANTILNRSENPEVKWASEAQKNTVLAQARLIRAWAYRHLTYCWGDVPLNLTESSGTNIKTDWTREPQANILKAMEADWLFAEQHLPEVHTIPGRLNKAVARHYLAELYLWMGDNTKAEQKAAAVVNGTNFKLITARYGVRAGQPGVPFMDQFYDGNVFRSQGNTEVLWEMPHDRDVIGGGGNIMRRVWLTRYDVNTGLTANNATTGRGSEFLAVTQRAFTLYEPQDDRGSYLAIHRFLIRSTRDTLFTTSAGAPEQLRNPRWPSTRKWDDGDPTDPGRNLGYNDQPYLRLAETYLLLAEAQHKLGKNAEAAQTMNTLRKRAKATEINADNVNIDFILDERTRELLTEEHRRYTLLRLNKWLDRTKAYNKQASGFIEPHNVLYPIPQAVIDANLDAKFPQNPGY